MADPLDKITLDDDVPSGTTGDPTDTFKIDDSALQGTLEVFGNTRTPSVVADTFEVTDTPTSGLITSLTGGTGANLFDIVHDGVYQDGVYQGGVNLGMLIAGGSGSNSLVLERPQSSAAVPDSLTLAVPTFGLFAGAKQVQITGSETQITVSGVLDITVDMYGGTLDAGDLSRLGAVSFVVVGKLSPMGDPNHVVIEPPLAGAGQPDRPRRAGHPGHGH